MENDEFTKSPNADAYIKMLLFDARIMSILMENGVDIKGANVNRDYNGITNDNIDSIMTTIIEKYNAWPQLIEKFDKAFVENS